MSSPLRESAVIFLSRAIIFFRQVFSSICTSPMGAIKRLRNIVCVENLSIPMFKTGEITTEGSENVSLRLPAILFCIGISPPAYQQCHVWFQITLRSSLYRKRWKYLPLLADAMMMESGDKIICFCYGVHSSFVLFYKCVDMKLCDISLTLFA